jgi:ubiquinone/menaquinone biosynthesis C-methylase UbiE
MTMTERKDIFKLTFNAIARGYDNKAMQFFQKSAERIPAYLKLNGDEHILDVATGTGHVALNLAGKLLKGHVTGMDLSDQMLACADEKCRKAGYTNVTFLEMDMQSIEFPDNHFDAAVSAFSLFFVDDMETQLAHFSSKVKRGGQVLVTTFGEKSFTPLVKPFFERLERYGIEIPSVAWTRVATEQQCQNLFKDAGLLNTTCEEVECGYYLNDPEDWWQIIWNGGFRGLVNQLSKKNIGKFESEHMKEVSQLADEKGVWLEMSILYTMGTCS